MDESDKKKRLLKRLKYIEDKNEEQLVAIKDQGEKQLDAVKNYGAEKESLKELEFADEKQQQILDKQIRNLKEKQESNILCVHTNGEEYDYNKFALLEQFYYDLISGKVKIKQAKDE